MRSNGYFRRHTRKTLRPVGRAVPGEDIAPLVATIDKRMRGIRHRTQSGAYLLADEDGYVYVLAEQPAINERIVNERIAWLVGTYDTPPGPEEIRGSLIAHFVEIGYVSPALIYDVIRRCDEP